MWSEYYTSAFLVDIEANITKEISSVNPLGRLHLKKIRAACGGAKILQKRDQGFRERKKNINHQR